jgi:predicted DNA-binding transcriptional regulator YafY
VNKHLESISWPTISSTNTIRTDLEFIEMHYPNIRVIDKHYGRNLKYTYEDHSSSIFQLTFSDDEIAQLTQCIAILSKFQGLPQSEWLEDFLERAKVAIEVQSDGKPVVGFDECPYLTGRELFAKLLTAILKKRVLHIHYKNFRTNVAREMVFTPYYLKEYNKRWFLFGVSEGYTTLTNLALDRIESAEEMPHETYVPNEQYDFNNDYFEDIVGVTHHEGPEQTIQLRVNNETLPYIKTKPLHGSQRVVDVNDQYTTISIQVIPNFELEQLLLTYGEGVTVLSPDTFKERMRQRIAAMARNYEE